MSFDHHVQILLTLTPGIADPESQNRLAWSGSIPELGNYPDHNAKLAHIFETFGLNRPDDYHARSLTVGDFVIFLDADGPHCYQCANQSWTEIW